MLKNRQQLLLLAILLSNSNRVRARFARARVLLISFLYLFSLKGIYLLFALATTAALVAVVAIRVFGYFLFTAKLSNAV